MAPAWAGGCARAAGAAAGAGGVGAATVAAATTGSPVAVPVVSVRITVPSDTLSPTLTLMSFTAPASGAGTSIVALSDSSVISASSAFTVSPGLTMISITGTSLKSPMSGTLTSGTPVAGLVGGGGAATDVV